MWLMQTEKSSSAVLVLVLWHDLVCFVSCFIAGLMVGRAPEYLGKKLV